MSDFNLHPPVGAKHSKKIVGRGQGSGHGTTAGRGNKGQQSRSGGKTYPGFEGGQMPLFRRIAKRGFSNQMFSQDYQIVKLGDIESRFAPGETVNGKSLLDKGLVKKADKPIKVLANGVITKALTFDVDKLSETALAKIEKAGGKVQAH